MTIQRRVTSGVLWNFGEQLIRRGVGILVTLALARFLVPADYGLMAMMAVFIAIAGSLMDSGLKQALIRKRNVHTADLSTAFYVNILLGLIAYGALFAFAPLIASFYEESRLTLLIRILGPVILTNALGVVPSAVLTRQLNFKAQLQAAVPAACASGVIAVALAYADFGVWALIAQMHISALAITVLLWRISGWRPTLEFEGKAFVELYNFGYKLFLAGLLDTVFRNIHVIVIAKLFTATTAGYYFFADKIKELVLAQIVRAIQNVTYPALATIQDDDVRLKAGYRKVIQMMTFLLFPTFAMLAALAEPLFEVFLPGRWIPAVPYFQLICLASLLYPLHTVNLNILKVKGRSDLFLYLELTKKTIAALVLVVSVQYGVIGILIGQIVLSVVVYIPNSHFSKRLIGYTVREQLADFFPGLVLSLSLAATIYAAVVESNFPPLFQVVYFSALSVTTYLAIAFLLRLQALEVVKESFTVRRRRGAT